MVAQLFGRIVPVQSANVRRALQLLRPYERAMESAENRKAWVDYLSVMPGGRCHPDDLLKADIRLEFKALACFVRLVPKQNMLPFDWNWGRDYEDGHTYMRYGAGDSVKHMPEELLPTVAIWVSLFSREVSERPRQFEDAEYLHAGYQELTLPLLARLPVGAESSALFEQYAVRFEYETKWGTRYEYDPYERLLYASIPEVWKWKAEQQMRGYIRDEERDVASKPESARNAFSGYVYAMEIARTQYSTEFLVTQLEFVLDRLQNWDSGSSRPLLTWAPEFLARLVEAGDIRSLRVGSRLTDYLIRGRDSQSPYSVYSTDSLQAVGLMLEHFCNGDPALREQLEEVRQQGVERLRRESEKRARRQAAEKAVWAAMAR